MLFTATDLIPILPELVILLLASIILVVDLYLKEEDKGINHTLAIIGLLIAIAAVGLSGGGERQYDFDSSFVRDAMP